MPPLENFHSIFGTGTSCVRPSAAQIKRYSGRIDDELLAEWKQRGWCSYADGAFWLVNPDDFAKSLREWLPRFAKRGLVFARSGFGDLLISAGRSIIHLNVHFGRYVKVSEGELGLFVDVEISRKYVAEALEGNLTKKAVKKLGGLNADEMFTFVPALALGGGFELKYVKKVKMLPQLSMLSQLYDEIVEQRFD